MARTFTCTRSTCAQHIEDYKVGTEVGLVQKSEHSEGYGSVNYPIHQTVVAMLHQPTNSDEDDFDYGTFVDQGAATMPTTVINCFR